MRDHEARFRQKVRDLQGRLAKAEQSTKRHTSFAPILLCSLLTGLTSVALIVGLVSFGLPFVVSPSPDLIPAKLEHFTALYERGQLDYFETNLPERGKVGMYLIGGGAEEAFIDGDHAVIVMPIR